MSVNPDGTDSTDYSDFEYQTAVAIVEAEESVDSTGTGNIFVRSVQQVEPLGGIGGLDNNEVAELVYLEVDAKLSYEDSEADQDVGTSGRVSGVVGANLAAAKSSFPISRQDTTSTAEIVRTDNIDEANVNLPVNGGTEDQWFQPFQLQASPPFDDEANGTGGGSMADSFYADKAFRQLVGRGPVLDASDDISIGVELNVDDTIIDQKAIINVHMVWDVAETSDAGRAFSVPMDD